MIGKWNVKKLPELSKEPCCDPVHQLEIRNLCLSYAGKYAFKDINLDINKGCITGVIGPSGCGKSSFLHSLNRLTDLNPEISVEGIIRREDKNLLAPDADLISIRKKMGLIFQDPTPLPISIYDNIAIGLKEHKFDNIERRVEQSLKDVGLYDEVKDNLKTSANKLSGGQKQRLCIARSLALEPDVLLLDEPCSSLDPGATEKIESLFLKLKKKYTLILVTHNLAQARRVCDHVALFWYDDIEKYSKLVESGTAFNFFENPSSQLTKEYISGARG